MEKFKIVSCLRDNKNEFYSLLSQLRHRLTYDEFAEILEKAQTINQYTLIGVEEDDVLVALMGFRILFDFIHGKHLYIDDLVTSQEVRSKGVGSRLLKEAEKIARMEGCKKLRLCTGIDNDRGRSFYLKNGWEQKAIVFKKALD